jgi:hypothetical protein
MQMVNMFSILHWNILRFVAIIHSITSQNPYKLFDELQEDENA